MADQRILLPAHDIWAPGARGESHYYEKACIGHGVFAGVTNDDPPRDVYQCEQCRQLVPVERTRR